MDIKTEQPKKQTAPKMPLGVKRTLLLLLAALAAKMGISAEEIFGAIVAKIRNDTFGISVVLVDTTGDGIPDYAIEYYHVFMQGASGALVSSLLERGASVSFDNKGADIATSMGHPVVGVRNLISINGLNMLAWLPNSEASYPYAAEVQRRTQTAPPTPAPNNAPLTPEEQRLLLELLQRQQGN
jgi:hypothetical protein